MLGVRRERRFQMRTRKKRRKRRTFLGRLRGEGLNPKDDRGRGWAWLSVEDRRLTCERRVDRRVGQESRPRKRREKRQRRKMRDPREEESSNGRQRGTGWMKKRKTRFASSLRQRERL